ncbi:ABC transporter ATP-binding protein [Gordonia shandongensis]|uniref:ABC transporter ATP-binding protein n=1 Tax=Gordonia shandongensis TaxID=376351 RepID=UPI0004786E3B|nr:ABC transporter ATP-binding protein [Gordonia shandongensis]
MTTTGAPAALPVADGATTARYVRGLFADRRWALIAVFCVLSVGAALGLAIPWAFGALVDAAGDDAGVAAVLRIGGAAACAAVGSAALTGLGVAASAQVFETALARLRERLVAAALRMSQAQIEQAGSGDLVSRATDDIGAISQAISRGVPALARSGFAVAASIVGFAALDWRFLLVVAVVLPVYGIAAQRYLRTAPAVYAAERAATGARAHHLLGAIRGLPTVHAYGVVGRSKRLVAGWSWRVVRETMRARIVQNQLFGRVNLAEFTGMAAVLLLGCLLIEQQSATLGAITTAMLLYLRLFGPIGALLLVMDDVQSAAASLARVVGVVSAADGAPAGGGVPVTSAGRSAPGVTVDQASFAYGPDRRVLDAVDLTIAPGETVAVVGASGAGKSTLAALVAGVHRPDSGTVRIAGRPVAEADGETAPVLLTQDGHVFAGTVAADLRMGAPSATDAEVAAALDRVGARDWVSRLPDGPETVVGAGGHALTPMQEQQTALARVLLNDPPVVILDEATADADSSDAGVLEDAVEAVVRGRTALVVAHRLSQAARADRILVMENGKFVESGSHADLLTRGGRYAELWSAWSRFREDDRSR